MMVVPAMHLANSTPSSLAGVSKPGRRLPANTLRAASKAASGEYKSATQFTREYARVFVPPPYPICAENSPWDATRLRPLDAHGFEPYRST